MAERREVIWLSFLLALERLFSSKDHVPRRVKFDARAVKTFGVVLSTLFWASFVWVMLMWVLYPGNELPFLQGVGFLFAALYMLVAGIGWWFARKKMWKLRVAGYSRDPDSTV